MKLITILGARPQFIKASVVSHAIALDGAITETLVHTGQHFDDNMSTVFFAELGIPEPAYHLGVKGGTHGEMTGRMLIEVERVLLDERPDAVLVYGDTNSTLAGALAAAKLHIPIAHVEAGLRSFDMRMPEEINRIVADQLSQWLFTPTEAAAANLVASGISCERIVPVGDVMYDVALRHGARVSDTGRVLGRLGLEGREYVLATIHRAENTDDAARLATIADALEDVSRQLVVVWPLHPRTRSALHALGRLHRLEEYVRLVEPVGYLDMVQLEKCAAVIATDSGGVQKEAFFHRVPCVTLRDSTEWTELVSAGWNSLVLPVSSAAVSTAISAAIGTSGTPVDPYGDGTASERIARHLARAEA
jgi:UDP-GlcNAc3NAcA epimerase